MRQLSNTILDVQLMERVLSGELDVEEREWRQIVLEVLLEYPHVKRVSEYMCGGDVVVFGAALGRSRATSGGDLAVFGAARGCVLIGRTLEAALVEVDVGWDLWAAACVRIHEQAARNMWS